MRVIIATALSCLVAGCGGSGGIEGQWSGGCHIDDEAWPEPVAVSLKVDEDNGSDIVGEGSFSIPEEGKHGMDSSSWSAELEGSHVGQQIELALNGSPEFGYEEVEMRLEISAELQDDAMDGDCTLAGVGGSVELRR